MCGFGGILNSAEEIHDLQIKNIASKVAFRGPDCTKTVIYSNNFIKSFRGNHGFFFNRLAIIDLDSRSNQPFENDRYTLLFNGEIYNYQEIKKELIGKGESFSTQSDTEVLFKILIIEGVQCIKKLNGMFAFFFFDRIKGSFIIGRDRLGIKPLYYRIDNQSFIFGSEIDSISRLQSSVKLNDLAVQMYMVLQYVPTPLSIVDGTFKLPPGSYIEGDIFKLQERQLLVPKIYWDAYNESENVVLEKSPNLEELLKLSIEKQLQADVPLGLFLSSGVDSSLITAVVNKHFSKSQLFNFFTVAFTEQTASDESMSAIEYLNGFGNSNFIHHKLIVTPSQITNSLNSIYKFYDEPFGDPTALLNWCISEKAKKHVTVVLSGDGGDELFWGYSRYRDWEDQMKLWYKKLPCSNNIVALLQMLPPNRYLYSAMWRLNPSTIETYLNLVTNNYKFQRFLEVPELFWYKGLNKMKDRKDLPSLIDFKGYLPDAMLYKVDRSSMASSLEVRVPFLDNLVIDYALHLPFSEKSNSTFSTKAVLKKLLAELAPHYNLNQPKKGFNFPLEKWMNEEWKELIQDTITKDKLHSLNLDSDYYIKAIRKHFTKNIKNTMQIWYLFNLVLWYDKKFSN